MAHDTLCEEFRKKSDSDRTGNRDVRRTRAWNQRQDINSEYVTRFRTADFDGAGEIVWSCFAEAAGELHDVLDGRRRIDRVAPAAPSLEADLVPGVDREHELIASVDDAELDCICGRSQPVMQVFTRPASYSWSAPRTHFP